MRFFAVVLLQCVLSVAAWAQSNSSPTYRMDGQVSLLSNYVDYGLTQSNKDPALNAQFWFNWGPQFRLGLWGGSVGFKDSSSHFLLKLNADLKIVFSQNTDLTIKYSDGHYYKPETRNGNILGLHLNLFGYGVRYEQHSNFFGTEDRATSFAFTRTWDVFGSWKWENLLGYMMVKSDSLSNYFWYETYLGIKPGNIYYQIGGSYNSNAAQFNGAGDLAVLVKATVTF